MGIKEENVFISENGQVLEFTHNSGRVAGSVTAGRVLIDGLGVGDVGSIVLRDRKMLSQEGILIVSLTVDKATSQVVSGPEIYSRGFVYVRESELLLDEAREHVIRSLEKKINGKNTDWSMVKSHVKDSLSRFIWEKMHRRPMVLPIVLEV